MRKLLAFIVLVPLLVAIPAVAQDTAAPDEATAFYRVANFFAGDPVEIQVDDTPSDFGALEYPTISDWVAVPAGTYSLSVASGDTTTAAVPQEFEFAPDGWYTVAVVGAGEDGAANLQVIDETPEELLPGTSFTTFVNAVQDGPNVDFLRDDVTYIAGLGTLGNQEDINSQSPILDDVDTYHFQVVESENSDNVLVDLPDTELRENEHILIAAVGTQDPNDTADVEVIIDSTSMAEVQMLQGTLEEPGTIIQAAQADEMFAPWAEAVERAGLTETLSGEGPFTVFIPADFAFDELPEDIQNDPDALAALLQNHIVEGDLRSQDVLQSGTLTTLGGSQLTIEERGEDGFVNDAQIIVANVPATNGTIHVINQFAMPLDVSG
jgi:uncharacterized surface protein with fasciclin (FAS1) repeats